VPLSNDVDFSRLTALSAGFSGAEITAVCTEAAMLAIEKDFDGSGCGESDSSSNRHRNDNDSGCDSDNKTDTNASEREALKPDRGKLCVRMQELREAISATKPQITKDMLAFYADLVKRM
jgi:SpoVK/Ycf46/Vps4 family AAA+-type ATPase